MYEDPQTDGVVRTPFRLEPICYAGRMDCRGVAGRVEHSPTFLDTADLCIALPGVRFD